VRPVETTKVINKTMDLEDLDSDEAKSVIGELNALIRELRGKGLKISSWYGRFDLSGHPRSREVINRGHGYKPLEDAEDDKNFPWFLYWEIVWVTMNAGFTEGQSVLDLGGSSSLFSYYLASKGLDVTTVDLQERLVRNADLVAMRMKWKLKNAVMDIRRLEMDSQLDHVTSICVYEHIPLCDRIRVNERIRDLLVPGGRFSITFDYRNPSRSARIGSPRDVYEQFVKPSGLLVRGNQEFEDNGKNYLLFPFYYRDKVLWAYKVQAVLRGRVRLREFLKTKKSNDYTFGALFLEKP